MNIVPMDTMSGGREDLIGRDITIRITIEILESGLYNTGSIILLGVEVQTVLMLTTPVTNLGPGSSLHCPVWYTGISTGMILHGRYEAEGRRGITSTAGVGRRIRPSPGPSRRRGWPARRPDPPAPPVAADPGADLPAATPSAAAAVPAATGRSLRVFSRPKATVPWVLRVVFRGAASPGCENRRCFVAQRYSLM